MNRTQLKNIIKEIIREEVNEAPYKSKFGLKPLPKPQNKYNFNLSKTLDKSPNVFKNISNQTPYPSLNQSFDLKSKLNKGLEQSRPHKIDFNKTKKIKTYSKDFSGRLKQFGDEFKSSDFGKGISKIADIERNKRIDIPINKKGKRGLSKISLGNIGSIDPLPGDERKLRQFKRKMGDTSVEIPGKVPTWGAKLTFDI